MTSGNGLRCRRQRSFRRQLQLTWDAESQLKTAAGVTYTYDGDGRRVQKSNGKLYWYGAGGEILNESDAAGTITDEYVFFGGRRIARRNVSSGNIYYYFADHLGSSRVILQSGQTSPCYDADFDPFGGEHIVTNTCPQNYKFTGKERDTETNLDNFEARYYSSQFGRFHSADWSAIPVPVPYADLGNPQTLNLYAYVKNNPLNLTDPTGHIGLGGFHIGTGDARTMQLGGGGLDSDIGESWGSPAEFSSVNSEDNTDNGPSDATQASSASGSAVESGPVYIADNYNVDTRSHGSPHIDRVDDNGKLVGRYNEDGTPIKHKGETPPKIPKSDKEKFQRAADKLREYNDRKAKAEGTQGKNEQAPSSQQKKSPTIFNPNPYIPLCAGPCDGLPYFLPMPGIFPAFPIFAPFPVLVPLPA